MFANHHRRAACRNPPGSPSRTNCGRRGGSPAPSSTTAKRDATLLALKLQEDCGIDVVTDGEQSRQHFVHGFLEFVDGIDFARKVEIGNPRRPLQGDGADSHRRASRSRAACTRGEARLARAHTRRKLKLTLPGPMTIVDTIADAHYGDRVKMAMAFASLLNAEARALEADGVDVIQFDEPAFNVYMGEVKEWGIEALHRAIEGSACTTAVHICYGYGIKANIDWKATLGGEWRQYEEIFPALAKSRIDQVSVECRNSRVPMSLLKLLDGKDVQVGVIDVASDEVETPDAGRRRDRRGDEIRRQGARSSPAPIAAWRRCAATSRSPSSKRSARARSWRGRNSADFAGPDAAAGYLVAGQFLERAVASSTLSSSVAET